MPTTDTHALPFPDDEEWVNQGAYAIEQLAQRVDDVLTSSTGVAQIGFANNGGAVGVTPVTIGFPGTVAALGGFTWSGSVLTYTGPVRNFLAVAVVNLGGQPSGQNQMRSSVELWVSGVMVDFSAIELLSSTATLDEHSHAHRLAVPLQLNPGDTLQVKASAAPAVTAGLCGLRVFPLGASL